MNFDILTMPIGGASGILLCGFLVLYFWYRLSNADWLGVWALALFTLSAGALLVSLRASLGDIASEGLGTAIAIVGFGIMWAAARVFERQKIVYWPIAACGISWCLVYSILVILGYQALLVSVASVLIFVCLLLVIRTFWRGRGEKLPSRTPIVILLSGLAGLFLARALVSPFAAYPMGGGGGIEPFSVAFFVGSLFFFMVVISVLLVSLTVERAVSDQRSLARTDPLTGLLNRRSLDAGFGTGPMPQNTAVIVFDLDHFKNVNDQFGHFVGDGVICAFADTCRESFRQVDVVVRFGGEEFVIILPSTNLPQAVDVAERVRRVFGKKIVEFKGGAVACTVSAGVASVGDGEEIDLSSLLMNADQALFRAKRAGRNRVFKPEISAAA